MTKKLVFDNEFNGAVVGTIEEILEWCAENHSNLLDGSFYVLGEPIEFEDLIKDEWTRDD